MKEYKVFYLANVDEHPAAPDEGYVKLYCYEGDWYTKNSDDEIRLLSNVRVLDSDGNPFSNSDIQFEGAFNITEEGGVTIISLDYDGEDGIPEHGNEAHNPDFATLQQLIDHMEDDDDPHGYVSTWEDDEGLLKPRNDEGVKVANNFRVLQDGKVFIDDLADIIPQPVVVGTDGRLRTPATVDTYTLTINMASTAGFSAPTSGTVWIAGNGVTMAVPFTDGQCIITGLPNGTYEFSVLTEEYQVYSSDVTINGSNLTITATLTPPFGLQPGDTVEGRGGDLIGEGTASNLELAKPVAIVERGVNYTLTLPDAGDAKTVEMSARKAAAGEALTLVANGGFMMDGETGDVLTTTVKGAWVKVKSIDIDGTDTWVVIQDSGDWTIDTI